MVVRSASPSRLRPAATTLLEPGNDSAYRVEWVDRDHKGRAGLEAFIASEFFDMYGARVGHFCDMLAGCRDQDGHWVAALGFSFAKDGKTFLEQYLDAPLEIEIACRAGALVSRETIVEVGNLAATRAGGARKLILFMTKYLHQQGMAWVAFTTTRGLLNSFTRLHLKPNVLAEADPRRLPDAGKSWGSYYATKPHVMFGDIGYGYAQLVE